MGGTCLNFIVWALEMGKESIWDSWQVLQIFKKLRLRESDFPVSHLVVSGGPAANPQLSIPKAHVLSTYTWLWRKRQETKGIFWNSEADLRLIHFCPTLFVKAGSRFRKSESCWKNMGEKYYIKTPFWLIESLLCVKKEQQPYSLSVP